MNAVEIEEAVSELATQPFDAGEFAFQFLAAFGMKNTTVKRLRAGSSNSSDVPGGVLQRTNIHIATAPAGQVGEKLAELRASPKTAAAKAKFVLATDGETIEAEDLTTGEAAACEYADLSRHFGFFLPLAGISTVTEIKNNPIDIKATGRLNKLYVELLKDNPDWGTKEKRPALNQFMARLIFCFFAEDTGIFLGEGLFTSTIARMSTPGHGSGEERWGNTHEVLAELFRAMATDTRHNGQLDDRHRKAAGIKSWADIFPYVNGGLFSGSVECPKFSRIARSYLLRAGELSWKEINPDIFGSMIQAVADDDERGELGMHYTSVPNILKVLNPLFLDDLREQLEAAGDNVRKLRNLRKRMASIRVFDPACGSGNFLVIAYLKLREIEHEIVRRTGDDPRSLIKLTNFYGIEIKSFAVEIARLSLLIAEFQADCRYISQQEARAMVLPLHRTGQIKSGNALTLDWVDVCPPNAEPSDIEHDLAGPTGRMALDPPRSSGTDEALTFVCGNPPYKGSNWRSVAQAEDLSAVFEGKVRAWRSLDYVSAWFMKAAEYGQVVPSASAFVSTNSICQGEQVAMLWPAIFATGRQISFAHTPFKWSNLASNNAGVTVVVIGLSSIDGRPRRLYSVDDDGQHTVKSVPNINAYLIDAAEVIVVPAKTALALSSRITDGSGALDGGHLVLVRADLEAILTRDQRSARFVRTYIGSNELINGVTRWCLWIRDEDLHEALGNIEIEARVERTRCFRSTAGTRAKTAVSRPHKFAWINTPSETQIVIPTVFSERRDYVTAAYLPADVIVSNSASVVHDAPLDVLSVICSRMHMVWVRTVAGKLEERLRYTSSTCYNTFPLPLLTETQKATLARCAEDILLAREAHFPATIAELYDPEKMPDDLRRAHEANDETLERIYIGRRFRNDTERLEKLFEMYAKMTANEDTKNTDRAA